MNERPTSKEMKQAYRRSGKRKSFREFVRKEYGLVKRRGQWVPEDQKPARGRHRT